MVFIGYIPFKGLLGGVKQLGYHPKGTSIFPMNQTIWNIYIVLFCNIEKFGYIYYQSNTLQKNVLKNTWQLQGISAPPALAI